VKPRAKRFSPGYMRILAAISASPPLLSALYDTGLLPEVVDDKLTRSSRHCMLAFYAGWVAGRAASRSPWRPPAKAELCTACKGKCRIGRRPCPSCHMTGLRSVEQANTDRLAKARAG
jgi:hypothetical protein